MVIAVIIVAFLAVVLFNNFANYGMAYGNVSVNGKSVAGMTSEEIRTMLEADYGQKLSSGEVRIYANDSAKSRESNELSRQEAAAQAEQLSVDAAKAKVTSWRTTATGLRAQVPYEEVIEKALAAGRDGGPLGRLALFFSPQDITFDIQYDDKAIEDLATAIDDTIGDKRIDATVSIDEGSANAVKGHDGKMVDRDWLKAQLSNAFLSDGDEKSFIVFRFDGVKISRQGKVMSPKLGVSLLTEKIVDCCCHSFSRLLVGADSVDLVSQDTESLEGYHGLIIFCEITA